jgi:phospholipid transport system substrate-binding protein
MVITRAQFAELFHDDFDGPGIARFVVGRYWRTASPEEQQDFIKIFEDYVVFVYTARLGDFGVNTLISVVAEATATGSLFQLRSPGRATRRQ